MKDSINFQIDDILLHIPKNYAEQNDFLVQSFPKNYRVFVENNSDIYKTLQDFQEKNYLFIIDENVYYLYFQQTNLDKNKIFRFKASENSKTLEGVMQIFDFFNAHQLNKSRKAVVIGGGIVQDVSAFACLSFKRGIDWIYFPTTLLSMSDSCIGGKAGVNYKNAKNQIALFSTPDQVIINTHFLKTLEKQEIISGLGEIIKSHIIGGKELLENYQKNIDAALGLDYSAFLPLILGALYVKKAVIEKDEFEKNIRKILNYGHTIGHAIETLSEYKIPHGHAVIFGMTIINELTYRQKKLAESDKNNFNDLLLKLVNIDLMKNLPLQGILDLILKDKKTLGNKTTFAIVESLGKSGFMNVEIDQKLSEEIQNIIEKYFFINIKN